MNILIEGVFDGHFTKVVWNNGKLDIHPDVEKIARIVAQSGESLTRYPGDGAYYNKNFFSDPGAFTALIYNVLDEVTLIKEF